MQYRPEKPPIVRSSEPPSLPPKPPSAVWPGLTGAGFLLFGIVMEVAQRPIVPLTYRPAPAFVFFGLGMGFALGLRKVPPKYAWGIEVARAVTSIAIAGWSFWTGVSLLFPCLFEAAYRLTIAASILSDEFS